VYSSYDSFCLSLPVSLPSSYPSSCLLIVKSAKPMLRTFCEVLWAKSISDYTAAIIDIGIIGEIAFEPL